MTWTGPADIKAQVQRWWDRGELLVAPTSLDSQFPRRLKLKAPTSGELSERFDEVRKWVASLREVPHLRIEMREFNHRVLGRNMIPAEIWIDTLDDALAVISKRKEAQQFHSMLKGSQLRCPASCDWLLKRPIRALSLKSDWERILDTVLWIQANPRPTIYLRQVPLSGIDTKFIESHRGVLTELLDLVLPPELINAQFTGLSAFATRYGFRDKPPRIRFRILDSAHAILPTSGEQDITLDRDTFAELHPPVSIVFITENEINFLSFPPMPNSMIIFGSGYGFDLLGAAHWLHACDLFYWGDIDTHGFAILHGARAYFPRMKSLMMDETTLLAHRMFWGTEATPHPAYELHNLTVEEQTLYTKLKTNAFAPSLRLEQERIEWKYVAAELMKLVI